ncbi:MAG: sigma-70 family RNA polymerase sigma factor [Bacteroidia bacterium]|nr:sigma-70 family RNA polymerase sigma factor [Bacteroidia bacterium]
MSDEEIINHIKKGQYDKAMKKLYGYYSAVRAHVLKNSGKAQDAEDLYQEALIIFCKKVKEENFKLTSSINTFLFGISKMLWNEELRKRSRNIIVSEENLPAAFSDSEFEESLQNEHNFKKAEEAFKMLDERCRELLHMFYFKKMSMKVIADWFKFSTERVAKSQKYRCLEKAKEHLKNITLQKHLS